MTIETAARPPGAGNSEAARRSVPVQVRGDRPSSVNPGTSAVPTAATGTGRSMNAGLGRTAGRLMRELYQSIPAFGRALSILAGFVGCPDIIGQDEAHTADLKTWAATVGAGWGGMGLSTFLADHIAQSLWAGYGVAEAEIREDRAEVTKLWSYQSEYFRLVTTADGTLTILQRNAGGVDRGSGGGPFYPVYGGLPLDPLQAFVSTFDAQGGNPYGQPLFLACPTVAQVWTEAVLAHKSTWRRMGVPIFHVAAKMPEGFVDSLEQRGSVTRRRSEWAAADMTTSLADCTKSQVERGIAKDLVTFGDVTISVLGLEGISMDFQISKRQLLEEIVVASDVPPSLFGYAWSSTERMSSVQARKLVGRVWSIRAAVEPTVRRLLDLRQRLVGEARPYTLDWPDCSLLDLGETARASLDDARSDNEKLAYAYHLWTTGVWDQEQYAAYLTGAPAVKRAMSEPPPLSFGKSSSSNNQQDQGNPNA